jgi:hypothetical protein
MALIGFYVWDSALRAATFDSPLGGDDLAHEAGDRLALKPP